MGEACADVAWEQSLRLWQQLPVRGPPASEVLCTTLVDSLEGGGVGWPVVLLLFQHFQQTDLRLNSMCTALQSRAWPRRRRLAKRVTTSSWCRRPERGSAVSTCARAWAS